MEIADLALVRDAAVASNPTLESHWQAVKDWSEQDRYRLKTEAEARRMVAAVTDNANGVLPWIKGRW